MPVEESTDNDAALARALQKQIHEEERERRSKSRKKRRADGEKGERRERRDGESREKPRSDSNKRREKKPTGESDAEMARRLAMEEREAVKRRRKRTEERKAERKSRQPGGESERKARQSVGESDEKRRQRRRQNYEARSKSDPSGKKNENLGASMHATNKKSNSERSSSSRKSGGEKRPDNLNASVRSNSARKNSMNATTRSPQKDRASTRSMAVPMTSSHSRTADTGALVSEHSRSASNPRNRKSRERSRKNREEESGHSRRPKDITNTPQRPKTKPRSKSPSSRKHRSRTQDPEGRNSKIKEERNRKREASPGMKGRSKSQNRSISVNRMESSESRQTASSHERSNHSTSRHGTPIAASYKPGDQTTPSKEELESIALAQRLQQEEEEMAAGLSNRSHHSASHRKNISVFQVSEPQQSQWTVKRCLSLAVPVVIILAAVVGLAFAFSGGQGLPSLPGGTPPVFEDEDPFQGINPDEANRWNNRDAGLTLEVLNALDDNWEILFELAIDDWDAGSPDALTLVTTKVAVDNACEPVQGKLKVCNGDYGETRWRGINQVLLSNGYIISSVAKLNEFYLAQADSAQRRYTMCHEVSHAVGLKYILLAIRLTHTVLLVQIGHGFGLPHTDENFFNADLGNCMDYTSNPEANKSPDITNYAFLEDLYGPLRRRRLRTSELKDMPKMPLDLLLRYDEAILENEHRVQKAKRHWKVTKQHKGKGSEFRSVDLGDGFQVQFHMLLAE